MTTLTALRPLLDTHMVVVCALAVVGTYVSREAGVIVELPADLLGIAVIFPVVFSIASAYTRREDALRSFATLKANVASLHYAYRDWPEVQNALGDRGPRIMHEMLTNVANYFKAFDADHDEALRNVYRSFDAVSASYRDMLEVGVTRSELSRLSAFLLAIITEFEAMRNFALYRTPITLRSFSHFFLTVFPILLTPYFASIAYPAEAWLGYVVAFMYGLVLVGLDNVQDQLENPYDGIGPDDLHLMIADEYMELLESGQSRAARTR